MKTKICDKFETICRNVRGGTPAEKRWQWDDRFNVALIAVDRADMERFFSVLIGEFTQQWESGTIAKASKQVRGIVKDLFDIKPGQVVFAADEDAHSVLLGAWWPWANGSVVSFRLGIFAAGKERIDPDEAKRCLQDWFGIE